MTKKVRDIIDNIRSYHLIIADRYEELITSSEQSKKVQHILNYLSECERAHAKLLEKQVYNSSLDHVLNTWIKEYPEEPSKHLKYEVEKQLPFIKHDDESLLTAYRDQHHKVDSIYQQLTEIMSCESSKDYFTSLHLMEKQALQNRIGKIIAYEFI